MADLEGTVNFSDGELVGELGGVVIGGGEKPFVIPITTSKDSSGKTVYSTTVMFKDIEEAYKTGKRILLRVKLLSMDIDTEVIGASVTELSSHSTGGPEVISIDKLAMICDLMPGEFYPEKDKMFSATIYEFSYGANGATVTTNAVSIPTYDVINRIRSHVGMSTE